METLRNAHVRETLWTMDWVFNLLNSFDYELSNLWLNHACSKVGNLHLPFVFCDPFKGKDGRIRVNVKHESC